MRYCYFFLVGLLVVIWLQCDAASSNANEPAQCCFQFFRGKIPIDKIDYYLETKSVCPNAGVVFVTKKSIHVCVKPDANWVKRAMQQIDEQQLRQYK